MSRFIQLSLAEGTTSGACPLLVRADQVTAVFISKDFPTPGHTRVSVQGGQTFTVMQTHDTVSQMVRRAIQQGNDHDGTVLSWQDF